MPWKFRFPSETWLKCTSPGGFLRVFGSLSGLALVVCPSNGLIELNLIGQLERPLLPLLERSQWAPHVSSLTNGLEYPTSYREWSRSSACEIGPALPFGPVGVCQQSGSPATGIAQCGMHNHVSQTNQFSEDVRLEYSSGLVCTINPSYSVRPWSDCFAGYQNLPHQQMTTIIEPGTTGVEGHILPGEESSRRNGKAVYIEDPSPIQGRGRQTPIFGSGFGRPITHASSLPVETSAGESSHRLSRLQLIRLLSGRRIRQGRKRSHGVPQRLRVYPTFKATNLVSVKDQWHHRRKPFLDGSSVLGELELTTLGLRDPEKEFVQATVDKWYGPAENTGFDSFLKGSKECRFKAVDYAIKASLYIIRFLPNLFVPALFGDDDRLRQGQKRAFEIIKAFWTRIDVHEVSTDEIRLDGPNLAVNDHSEKFKVIETLRKLEKATYSRLTCLAWISITFWMRVEFPEIYKSVSNLYGLYRNFKTLVYLKVLEEVYAMMPDLFPPEAKVEKITFKFEKRNQAGGFEVREDEIPTK